MRAVAVILSFFVVSGRCGQTTQRNPSAAESQKASGHAPNSTEGLSPEVSAHVLHNAECGKTYLALKPRIIGGVTATFGQHPWQVALLGSISPPKQFCTGALISEKYVLTAAHCLRRRRSSSVTLRLGAFSYVVNVQGFPSEDFGIRKTIMHKGNKFARVDKDGFVLQPNDLALLELDRPVVFKKHIAPICLPERGVKFGGEIATAAGWEKLDTGEEEIPFLLQKADLKVMENGDCQAFIAANYTPIQLMPDNQLCTSFESIYSACEGDDGTPLVAFKDERAQVIGIASWSLGCGGLNGPTGYTNVTHYVDWINSYLENSAQSDG